MTILFSCIPFLDCPEDWLETDTYCYKMATDVPNKLQDARQNCQNMLAAQLPIIKSQQENTFIAGLMSDEKPRIWLGMKRENINGMFQWFDGTSAEENNNGYNAWANGKPRSNTFKCAYMSIHQSNVPGTWHDGSCFYYPAPPPFLLCQKSRL